MKRLSVLRWAYRAEVSCGVLLGERMQRMTTSWIFVLSLMPMVAGAQASEVERLSGFAEHQNNQIQFNKAREQGERAHLEREEQWETAKDRDLADYTRRKGQKGMSEDGPEARADEAEKKKYEATQEQARKAYELEKAKTAKKIIRGKGLPSENEEYGLAETRPRYDYKKREDFGAPSRYGKPGSTASSSGRGSGSGSSGGSFSPPPFQDSGSDGGSFPPPPTFDDFGSEGEGGFIPAPNMEDYGDIPPPPPPPPTFGEDFGGFNPDFPPPPPPPPGFGESY